MGLNFARGGWQECQGGCACAAMYIENVQGELDAPGEWWLDSTTHVLYFVPPAQWTEQEPQGADVAAPLNQTVIKVAGNGSEPAHDLHFEGFNITHAAISFLE